MQSTELETLMSRLNYVEQKRKEDIKSIRFAMQQEIETFDVYSEIANPIDEAMLVAMQRMLDTFETAVLHCESR